MTLISIKMFFCTSQWLKWLKMAELLRCFYIRRLLIVILKDKELKWGKHIYLSRQLNNIWAINQILFFRLSHIMFPVQYSCLENPMDRGTWKAAVHGVEKNRTRLSDFTFTSLEQQENKLNTLRYSRINFK